MGVREILVDDVDGTEGDVERFTLSLNDRLVELDLNKKNADKLTKAVTPFLDAGRPIVQSAPARTRTRATGAAKRAPSGSGRSDVAAVRQWARENGHQVPDRGRLKPEVFEAYDQAHA